MNHGSLIALHLGLALLSASGFVARWLWRMTRGAPPDKPWLRRLPHLLDTLLLATGLWLAWRLNISPMSQPWLAAKLLALVLYIALAWVAYRSTDRPVLSSTVFCAALLMLAWAASIAVTRSPLGWFSLI